MLKACANAGDSGAAEQLYQSMLSPGLSCLLVAFVYRTNVNDALTLVSFPGSMHTQPCPSSPGFPGVLSQVIAPVLTVS